MGLLPILRAFSSIFQHLVTTLCIIVLHSIESAFFLRLGSCPFCCCVTSWFIVSSFADVVVVVAVAAVAVTVPIVLVFSKGSRVASSDLGWVATGTNFILPLLCRFESRLVGCPIVSGFSLQFGYVTLSRQVSRRRGDLGRGLHSFGMFQQLYSQLV